MIHDRSRSSKAGIYVHVPFCTRRCDYCDFYVVVGRGADVERYVGRIVDEVRAAGERLGGRAPRVDSLYLGGGTPSLLAVEQVGRILAECRGAFEVEPGAEVTLEANPENIDRARLERWLETGVNRLSIGLQTIRDATLRARGRLHTGVEGLDAIDEAHGAGFANVSVDLIAGLPPGAAPHPAGCAPGGSAALEHGVEPGSAAAEAIESVRAVTERRPEHVSLYLLETDKEAPLMEAARAGRIRLPDDDEAAEAYEESCLILDASGYEHYEISSFCLPGRRSIHNLKHWTGEPFLGFGPGAFSAFGGRLQSIERDLDAFLEGRAGVEDRTPPGGEAAAREALILNLRLLEGVDLAAFDRRRGTALARAVPSEVGDLLEAGLVVLEGGMLRLTRRGLLLANEVFARLAAPVSVQSSPGR